jgi:hypothetical protein
MKVKLKEAYNFVTHSCMFFMHVFLNFVLRSWWILVKENDSFCRHALEWFYFYRFGSDIFFLSSSSNFLDRYPSNHSSGMEDTCRSCGVTQASEERFVYAPKSYGGLVLLHDQKRKRLGWVHLIISFYNFPPIFH